MYETIDNVRFSFVQLIDDDRNTEAGHNAIDTTFEHFGGLLVCRS